MRKYILILLVAFSKLTYAQFIVELQPLEFTPLHPFRIESVEDLRPMQRSIGQVQQGMLNAQIPAAFNSDLDIFLKKYLNQPLSKSDSLTIIIRVKKFWISEDTKGASELGTLESAFEVYLVQDGNKRLLLNENYNDERSGFDITKRHSENIYNVLLRLMTKIDLSLMPSDVRDGSTYAGSTDWESEQTALRKYDIITRSKYHDPSQYGGILSLGIAIGGGGIFGIPIRVYPAPKLIIEVGGYLRLFIVSQHEEVTAHPGFMLAGGPVFYLSEKIVRNTNLRLSGLSLKGGHSFGNHPESFAAIAWAMEKMKWENNNFSAEVGVGVTVLHSDERELNYALTNEKAQPFLYWKIHWSWYMVKRGKGDSESTKP